MLRICRQSFAKINLHLKVVGPRADGYHDLETIFQEIDLADDLVVEVQPSPHTNIQVVCPGVDGAPQSNLAWRAADLFARQFHVSFQCYITLHKRIPLGGGLGGGSSNAAHVLLALAETFSVPKEKLVPVARQLGADVPFFLYGGCAVGHGRGDEITVLPVTLPYVFVLVFPPIHVSTAEVFGAVRHFLTPQNKDGIKLATSIEKRVKSANNGCFNDLEEVSFRLYPQLKKVKQQLGDLSSGPVQMSGSGATFFVVMPSLGEGRELLDVLGKQGFLACLTAPIAR